jgi:peptide/nickel transport system substrate-binding protein
MLRIFQVSVMLSSVSLCLQLLVPSAGWAQTAKAGEELVVALSSFATETLDPALSGHIGKFYLSLLYDYVVGTTPDGKLSSQTGLSTKWELTPDKKAWVFELRQGVRFHNGAELTADDVKASIVRGLSKLSTTGYAGALRSTIKNIEVAGPHKLIIHMNTPSIIVPDYLSRALSSEGMVLPKSLADEAVKDQLARQPIGSGPYRFVEQVTGSHIKLEAVPNHWRVGTPKFKTITFRLVPEASTRIAMMRRGEVDIIDLSRERMAEVKKAGFQTVLRQNEALVHIWLIQNWEPNVPVHDKRVREAMNLAINRQELLEVLFDGMGEIVPIPYGLSWTLQEIGYKLSEQDFYRYDPRRAKQLMSEAGYANGFAMDFHSFLLPGFPEGRAFAEAVAGYWEKIGIKTKLIPVDYAAFRKKWLDKEIPGTPGYYNIANRGWVGTLALLEKSAYSPAVMTSVKDTQNDAWINELLTATTDEAKAFELMRNVFKHLRSEHYGIPLFNIHTPYAISKKAAGWNPGTIMYDFNLDELARVR